MSITSDQLRLLFSAGKSVRDAIEVARAQERGPDFRSISIVIDEMREANCDPASIAETVMEMARAINVDNDLTLKRLEARRNDPHRQQKDSNRSRRGMADNDWRKLRRQIFERDEFYCQYCGSEHDLTCDHITPLVLGGTNEPTNLTTACRSCNSSKGDKTLEEWVRT